MRIGDADPGEREALEALQRRAAETSPEDRKRLAAHPEVLGVPSRAIRDGRVRVAAGEDGVPLGFAVVARAEHGIAELDGLFVDPGAIGTGVGRALVEDAVARARHDGAVLLSVTAGPATAGFYERLGFRRGAAIPTPFGPGIRLHVAL